MFMNTLTSSVRPLRVLVTYNFALQVNTQIHIEIKPLYFKMSAEQILNKFPSHKDWSRVMINQCIRSNKIPARTTKTCNISPLRRNGIKDRIYPKFKTVTGKYLTFWLVAFHLVKRQVCIYIYVCVHSLSISLSVLFEPPPPATL